MIACLLVCGHCEVGCRLPHSGQRELSQSPVRSYPQMLHLDGSVMKTRAMRKKKPGHSPCHDQQRDTDRCHARASKQRSRVLEHGLVVVLRNTQQMRKAVAAATALLTHSPSLESQPKLSDLQGMPDEYNGQFSAAETKESNCCS